VGALAPKHSRTASQRAPVRLAALRLNSCFSFSPSWDDTSILYKLPVLNRRFVVLCPTTHVDVFIHIIIVFETSTSTSPSVLSTLGYSKSFPYFCHCSTRVKNDTSECWSSSFFVGYFCFGKLLPCSPGSFCQGRWFGTQRPCCTTHRRPIKQRGRYSSEPLLFFGGPPTSYQLIRSGNWCDLRWPLYGVHDEQRAACYPFFDGRQEATPALTEARGRSRTSASITQ
jgi:hypothetical protein